MRRPERIAEIEGLGVDFVGVESPELPKQIHGATGGKPISLGLDAVGGPAAATIAAALSPAAHFVSYAWLSGLPVHLPQGDLIGKKLNIRGFWMYYEEFLPKIRAALTEAAQVVGSGRLSLQLRPYTGRSKSRKQSSITSVAARCCWISLPRIRPAAHKSAEHGTKRKESN